VLPVSRPRLCGENALKGAPFLANATNPAVAQLAADTAHPGEQVADAAEPGGARYIGQDARRRQTRFLRSRQMPLSRRYKSCLLESTKPARGACCQQERPLHGPGAFHIKEPHNVSATLLFA